MIALPRLAWMFHLLPLLTGALWLLPSCCVAQVSLDDVAGQWRGGYVVDNEVQSNNCIAIEWVEQVVGFAPVPTRPLELRGLWERTARWVWVDPELARQAACRWSGDADFQATTTAFGRQAITARLTPASGKVAVHLRFLDCAGPLCQHLLQQSGMQGADGSSADHGQDFELRYSGQRLLTGASDGARPVELHRTADEAEDIGRLEELTASWRKAIFAGDFAAVRANLVPGSTSLSDRMLTRLQSDMASETAIFSDSHVMTFDPIPRTGDRRIIAILSSLIGRKDDSTFYEFVFLEWQDRSWKLLGWLHE